jgi:hypothetical protein
MRRREFIILVGGMALTGSTVAYVQAAQESYTSNIATGSVQARHKHTWCQAHSTTP